ncbi:hypothetical protein ACO1O0_004258 [Amphichorda felina]
MEDVSEPLTLKCGLTLPNRLVKAALAENMADSRNLPHAQFYRAYSKWADGGWGMIFTGNVFVDPAYLGTPREVCIPTALDGSSKAAFARWAEASSAAGTPALVQLNHPGRQSQIGAGTRSIWAKTIAPSPVPLDLGPGIITSIARRFLFGTPREMTSEDINLVIAQFARSARVVAEAGFAGVELHAAHGYLLAQFMSKKTNLRQDEWGGDPERRVRIVVEIIRRMREATPKSFAIGIKLNSADHQNDQDMEETMTQVKAIVEEGVDFVEISGGTWEDPQMMADTPAPSARTQAREAFFLTFAKAVRSRFPDAHLMVTGGFRSRGGMTEAVQEGACDLIGLGRPSVMDPALPKNTIFNSEKSDSERLYTATMRTGWLDYLLGSRAVGAGIETIQKVLAL